MNVNWVGVSTAFFVTSVDDSSVEFRFRNDSNQSEGPLFSTTAANLEYVLSELSDNGFNTYLTVAFEDPPFASTLRETTLMTEDYPPVRWLFGRPYFDPEISTLIAQEDWAWDAAHPNYSEFTSGHCQRKIA